MFEKGFDRYACEGDTIKCEVDGFTVRATIRRDDCNDKPDERQDGFWPSLDPESAGYIGPKSKSTLRRHMAKAKEIMRAWEDDEWFYCGIVLDVWRDDIRIEDHAASLWGVECNYPGTKNEYLLEVANELLDEALDLAKAKLAKLCQCEGKGD